MSPPNSLYQTSESSQNLSPSSVSDLLALVSVLKPGIILSTEESKTPIQIAAIAADKARAASLLGGLLGPDGELISISRAKEIEVD